MAKKPYWECHITCDAESVNTERARYAIENLLKWKFSKIDGDPELGKGVKIYATMHYSTSRFTAFEVQKKVQAASARLGNAGLFVLREKIEAVIYDKRFPNG